MGNSPPARKVALSPEIAVSVGSARVRSTPARSIACKVELIEPKVAVTLVLPIDSSAAENGLAVTKLRMACPLPRPLPVVVMLMPNCLTTSRCTSATVTLSMTWSRPRMAIWFTTLMLSPASLTAMS